MPVRMESKWSLKLCMVRSAALGRCMSGGEIW